MKYKNEEVEKTVFRIFLKHIKANKLYIPFRWSVNHSESYKDFIHILSPRICNDKYYHSIDRVNRIGSAFITARSVSDIIKMLGNEKMTKKVENNSEFQLSIMNMVNCLLHNCIEYSVVDNNMQILEKLGSAIFEESCKTLIGDTFKDMTEEAIDPRQKAMFEKMREMNGGMMPSIDMLKSREFLKMLKENMRERREAREQIEMERPSIWYHHPSFDYYQLDARWI